jgi:hypothetical protein
MPSRARLDMLAAIGILACSRSGLLTPEVGTRPGSGGSFEGEKDAQPGDGVGTTTGTTPDDAGGPESFGSGSSGGSSTGTASSSGTNIGTDAGTVDDAAPSTGGGPGQVLYTRCSVLGELDCSVADPKIRLLCDGMTWNPIGVCTGAQACDTRPGPDHGLCTGPDAGASSNSGAPPSNAGSAGVALYARCSTLGALDCSQADPKIQLLCDGMTWGPIGTCSGQLVCDPLPGPDQGLCKAP